jgi:cell division protein FtsQ
MTTRVDPRLAQRRRAVAEGNARRRLRKIFWALVVVSLAGAIGWLAQSPWFSISHVAVSGVSGSDSLRILETARVVEGTPLILVAPRRVEELLEADPWVIEATVRRVIPDAVEVVVTERTPLVWVEAGNQWAVIAEDSVVLRYDPEPGGPSMVFDLTSLGREARVSDQRVAGGVAFVAGLPAEIRAQVSMTEQNGELWAFIGGLVVRLGLPTEMAEKAAALTAILDEGLSPGSMVNLVAPTRPAVVEA